MKVWRMSGLPQLDEELIEFFEYMAMRVSKSLKKVEYEELCKLFGEDYLVEPSRHEDSEPFVAVEDDNDEADLQVALTAKKSPDGSPEGGAPDREMDSDELMLHIDEALSKIVSKLPA